MLEEKYKEELLEDTKEYIVKYRDIFKKACTRYCLTIDFENRDDKTILNLAKDEISNIYNDIESLAFAELYPSQRIPSPVTHAIYLKRYLAVESVLLEEYVRYFNFDIEQWKECQKAKIKALIRQENNTLCTVLKEMNMFAKGGDSNE